MVKLRLEGNDPQLVDHKLNGRSLLPAAVQIKALLLEGRAMKTPAVLDGIAFRKEVRADEGIELEIKPVGNRVELRIGDETIASAVSHTIPMPAPVIRSIRWEGLIETTEQFRRWRDEECPLEFGPTFDVVRMVWRGSKKVIALLNEALFSVNDDLIPVSYFDAVFQLLAFAGGNPQGGGFPWTVRQLCVIRRANGSLYCSVELGEDGLSGDASLLSLQGEVIGWLEGIRLKKPTQSAPEIMPDIREVLWAPEDLGRGKPAEVVRTLELSSNSDDHCQALIDSVNELQTILLERPRAVRVVTRFRTTCSRDDGPDPLGMAIGAMIRVLKKEYPRITFQWLDVPSERELLSIYPSVDETSEAFWTGSSWVKLVQRPVVHRSGPSKIAGHWLIIGGFSAIVRELIPSFLKMGCEELTLLVRREPSEVEKQWMASLDGSVSVSYLKADVIDESCRLPDRMTKVDVVVNAVGVLEDSFFALVSDRKARAVLESKVSSAFRIGSILDRNPAAVAITFSSIASVDGRIGQSIYAAANAYQDALAERYRARGARWYTLLWDLWDIGMGQEVAPSAERDGYPVLNSNEGAALFLEALTLDPGAYILRAGSGSNMGREKGKDLYGRNKKEGAMKEDQTILELLCRALEEVLECPEVLPEDSPEELGLDSMMAVEVSAKLADAGVDIEPADLFVQKTIRGIADHGTLHESKFDWSSNSDQAKPIELPHSEPEEDVLDTITPRFDGRTSRFPNVISTDSTRLNAKVTGVPRSMELNDPSTGFFAPRFEDPVRFRTLPSTLSNLATGSPLDDVINDISRDDRKLVASGNYFYEPVVEAIQGSRIRIEGNWKLNFASYSYLGFIKNEFIDSRASNELRRMGTASHGVRLLSGTTPIHRQLEMRIGDFLGRDDSIVFSSGYMANVATIAALAGEGDIVVGDSLNHASLVDGCLLSGAQFLQYSHNDPRDLDRVLKRSGFRHALVVTDAVFSMDGDIADLPAIVDVCRKHGASLMVDEAHSVGVIGDTGRGIVEHYGIEPDCVDVSMGTLSKTIPSAGGFVAGSSDLIFALKNGARGWMFSAAIPPAQAAAADAAFELISASPERIVELRELTRYYREELQARGLNTMNSSTPIVPVRCSSIDQALALAKLCQDRGLFVQPITYPTVPKSSPRLRTIVNLSHTREDLDEAVSVITAASKEISLIRDREY